MMTDRESSRQLLILCMLSRFDVLLADDVQHVGS